MDKLLLEPVEGRCLRLRRWRLDDLEQYRFWRHPRHLWHDYNGPYFGRSTNEEVDNAIEKMRRHLEAGTYNNRILVIADREQDGLLGTVNWYWQSEVTHWLSVGIVLFDDGRWGQGLGYEALGLWSQHILDCMPELVRLDLRTWSGNVGMMKLASKLGYREEARFRMARIVKGKHYDSVGYGVLRNEWKALYPNGFAETLWHEA